MSSSSDNDIFITQSIYKITSEEDNMNYEQPNFQLKTDLFSDISSDEDVGESKENIGDSENKETTTNTATSSRFSKPLQKVDIDAIVNKGLSKKTEAKTQWAIRLFHSWHKQRHESRDDINILELTKEDLNNQLTYFIAEVRNEKGNDYNPNTLYEIVIAIQHHLRQNGIFISLLDDKEFAGMRQVLDGKMKDLSRQGIGIHRKQADVISTSQEDELWERGFLGMDTPQKLLDTLLYTIGLNFALRAGSEHRDLRVGQNSQIEEKVDEDGRKYLEYTEDISKTNRGGLQHRKVTPKTTRAYEDKCKPERCPVMLYQKYLSLRPKNGKCQALYLRPRKYTTSDIWYCDSPVGVHLLQKTIKSMCERAGFKGFFTNHSLRSTAATRMYANNCDEQLIAEKTGHRSNAVRSYKRTSSEQQAMVSSILHGSNPSKKTKTDADDIQSKLQTGEATAILKSESNRTFSFQAKDFSFELKF